MTCTNINNVIKRNKKEGMDYKINSITTQNYTLLSHHGRTKLQSFQHFKTHIKKCNYRKNGLCQLLQIQTKQYMKNIVKKKQQPKLMEFLIKSNPTTNT